jgi:hypothetical protein
LSLAANAPQRAAVARALEESIAHHEQRGLLDLFGTLDWDTGFDHKKARSRE